MCEPIKTISISTGTRLYYLDIFRNNNADRYVTLSELSVGKDRPKKKMGSVLIYEDQLQKILEAIQEAKTFLTNSDNS